MPLMTAVEWQSAGSSETASILKFIKMGLSILLVDMSVVRCQGLETRQCRSVL